MPRRVLSLAQTFQISSPFLSNMELVRQERNGFLDIWTFQDHAPLVPTTDLEGRTNLGMEPGKNYEELSSNVEER